jgi:hypothetical protein
VGTFDVEDVVPEGASHVDGVLRRRHAGPVNAVDGLPQRAQVALGVKLCQLDHDPALGVPVQRSQERCEVGRVVDDVAAHDHRRHGGLVGDVGPAAGDLGVQTWRAWPGSRLRRQAGPPGGTRGRLAAPPHPRPHRAPPLPVVWPPWPAPGTARAQAPPAPFGRTGRTAAARSPRATRARRPKSRQGWPTGPIAVTSATRPQGRPTVTPHGPA